MTPADPAASAALAEQGLRYGLVDTGDPAAFGAWLEADHRGFHRPRLSPAERDALLAGLADRRTVGVWDDSAAEASTPVATVSSWLTDLTTPGGRVPGWAVSSVTVAPTHRRRGIARQLMEAELRVAHASGAALAMLTASEATIYERYGYAPAASVTTVEVDRRRVAWRGEAPPGRVHFVEPAALRGLAAELSARVVARTPGEIGRWPLLFDEILGLIEPGSEDARAVRAIRYDDADGAPQGLAVFRLKRGDRPVLHIEHFAAASDDAYAGLWKFLLEYDLIDAVRASLRPVDETLPWLITDRRAITWSEATDHLWLRILDPVTALGARRYAGEGALTLEIADPSGFAGGRVELRTDSAGRPVVATTTDAAELRLGVPELSAIYLGGVRPSLLGSAGRIAGSPEAIMRADRLFGTDRAPHLGIWF